MENHTAESCAKSRLAIQDTLEVLNGKWKLLILITLQHRPYRFKELAREIGITPRMLSKELQELEEHQLISRTVLQTKPVSVQYAITPHGTTLDEVLGALRNWGMKHRWKIITAPEAVNP
ncbi:HxlR family transcriptional regulator [Larkinella arboricola]|uniref:HxlR family transcriptional regulator n=1 Tax=Larkinella arboricola TaxID=643671 RepID=A0A327X715_LARAB|nr:helix-turn-helix domain-containing protein [Larkinella arboricola]RAK02755.1 HxlR family transcriptional regulator [Larkinella arboricola]